MSESCQIRTSAGPHQWLPCATHFPGMLPYWEVGIEARAAQARGDPGLILADGSFANRRPTGRGLRARGGEEA